MTSPLHLFFDSSAIRAELPTSPIMSAVARLSSRGAIRVHVPSLVVAEISSQNLSQIRQIEKDLRRVVAWLPVRLRGPLTDLVDQFTEHSANREQLVRQGVQDWLQRLDATSDSLDASMTSEVFDRYFDRLRRRGD